MNLSNCVSRMFLVFLILVVLSVGAYSVLAFLFVVALAIGGLI